MPNFLTRTRFLQILHEEKDKMVYEEGLLLRDKFCEEVAKRLEQEIEQGPCLTKMPV
jgi:hypothetical protein